MSGGLSNVLARFSFRFSPIALVVCATTCTTHVDDANEGEGEGEGEGEAAAGCGYNTIDLDEGVLCYDVGGDGSCGLCAAGLECAEPMDDTNLRWACAVPSDVGGGCHQQTPHTGLSAEPDGCVEHARCDEENGTCRLGRRGDGCRENEECESGLCGEEGCVPNECTADADCEGEVCRRECGGGECVPPAGLDELCASYTDFGCGVTAHACADGLVCSSRRFNSAKYGSSHCLERGSEGAACDRSAPDCTEDRVCISNCSASDRSHCSTLKSTGDACAAIDSQNPNWCFVPCVAGLECGLMPPDSTVVVCAEPAIVGDACDARVASTDSQDDGCVEGAHCDQATSTCQPD